MQPEPLVLIGHRFRRSHEQLDSVEHVTQGVEPGLDLAGRNRLRARLQLTPDQGRCPRRAMREPPRRSSDHGTAKADLVAQGRHGHLRVERRMRKARTAPCGVDVVADCALDQVQPLAARRADEAVIVKGGDDRGAPGPCQARQLEAQVEQAVDVHDIGLRGVQHALQLSADPRLSDTCPRTARPSCSRSR